MVRLLIADSSELSLLGLKNLFLTVSDVHIVGEASSMGELEIVLNEELVDVLLIDQSSTGFGAEALKLVRKKNKRCRVVCITHDPTAMTVRNAIRLGVRSYVKKDCDLQEIIDAVRSTAFGDNFFCGQILQKLEVDEVDLSLMFDEPLTCAPVSLSKRETEIICLIVEGYSYTRIAEKLHISAHTVTTHRKNIMGKLGVHNTPALVMYAVKEGLVSPNRFLFSS